MSPSEYDLRAALHDDEGDGPDPDAIIAAGRTRASARRTRIIGAAGAVVAVLAIGTGGFLIGRDGNNHHDTADNRAAVPAAPRAAGTRGSADSLTTGGAFGAATGSGTTTSGTVGGDSSGGSGGGGATNPSPAASRPTGPATCPAAYGANGANGGLGGGTSSTDPLIPQTATSVLVCGYGSTGDRTSATPTSTLLTGAAADQLVASLNSAATSRPRTMCPDFRVADDQRYAFVGRSTSTVAVGSPVFTTLGNPTCSVIVTNGTTVRYDWAPPVSLSRRLQAAQPK